MYQILPPFSRKNVELTTTPFPMGIQKASHVLSFRIPSAKAQMCERKKQVVVGVLVVPAIVFFLKIVLRVFMEKNKYSYINGLSQHLQLFKIIFQQNMLLIQKLDKKRLILHLFKGENSKISGPFVIVSEEGRNVALLDMGIFF